MLHFHQPCLTVTHLTTPDTTFIYLTVSPFSFNKRISKLGWKRYATVAHKVTDITGPCAVGSPAECRVPQTRCYCTVCWLTAGCAQSQHGQVSWNLHPNIKHGQVSWNLHPNINTVKYRGTCIQTSNTVKYRGTCIQTSNTFHIFTEHQWNSFHWRHSLWMLYWCITHASALSAVKTSSFLVVVNWTQGTGYLHQSLLTDKHSKCRQTKATTILPCWQSHVVMSLI